MPASASRTRCGARARDDERAAQLDVVGPADGERGHELAVLQVPDAEGARGRIAVDDLLVPAGRRVADVLERRPVREVRPEVRHVVVGLLGAEHRAGDVAALRRRDLLVLDAQPAAVADVLELAHVAGGPDPLGRGPQPLVAGDAAAVAERQAGLAREHDVRRRADADDDEVGFDAAAVRADDRAHPALPRPRRRTR